MEHADTKWRRARAHEKQPTFFSFPSNTGPKGSTSQESEKKNREGTLKTRCKNQGAVVSLQRQLAHIFKNTSRVGGRERAVRLLSRSSVDVVVVYRPGAPPLEPRPRCSEIAIA